MFTSEPIMNSNNSTAENMTESIDKLASFPPYWTVVLRYMLFRLIIIIGILGNTMIILAVAFSRKLQTSTNVFVTSLAVTDLLTCFALGLGHITLASLPLGERLNRICQFVAFVAFASMGTSLYTLGAIGINRLVLISKPNLSKKIFTPCKLGIFVALVWIIPGGIILIALLNEVGKLGVDPIDHTCGNLKTHERAADLDLLLFVVGLPIPFVAIIVSYSWIYIYIKKHFKTQKQHLVNLRTTSPVSPESSIPLSPSQESMQCSGTSEAEITIANPRLKEISRQQIQITKNLSLVVFAFFICFIPLGFALLVGKPSPTVKVIVEFLELLGFANSATNFFIYASKHPHFKVVLRNMMRCSYSKIPQPSRLLQFLFSISKKN